MNDLSDRIDFLTQDRTRLDVALACRAGPRTKVQIAKALQRAPGSLSSVATLERHGALERSHDAPRRGSRKGGARWALSSDWAEAAEIASSRVAEGVLSDGLDLVLVSATDTAGAYDALSAADLEVSWGVPLRGEQMGLLICPSANPDEAKTLQVMSILGRRDIRPIRLNLPEIMSGRDLRKRAMQMSKRPDPGLPAAG